MSTTAFRSEPGADFRLEDSKNALTTGYRDPGIEQEIARIMARPGDNDTSVLAEIQGVMERMRSVPDGDARISSMNSFVRTLGRADRLATLLDALRGSLASGDADERKFAEASRGEAMHCIYGWAGQTLMIESRTHRTDGTTPPAPGVEEFFTFPVSEWHLSIHIWQANPEAQGFEATKNIDADVIVEPPHSHPFPFASYVSIGEMRQSIYTEEPLDTGQNPELGRYHDTVLERVDGIWPPHQEYRPSRIRTVENRLRLAVGDSYYMPTRAVHDVEVSRRVSSNTPAITLFLAAETTDIPHAYMASAMADFHRDHPDVLEPATALDPAEWDEKLAATSRYLRGEADHLRLNEIFECGSSYAFMHKVQ